MRPVFQVLNLAQRQQIAGAAMQLLAEVGVRLTEPRARVILRKGGARLSGDRAYLPASLVEAALQTVPHRIDICDRGGSRVMELGGSEVYFGAHTDAPDVLDPFTGSRRPCLAADVRRHALLIDALANIRYATASGLIADCPAEAADRMALAICLKQSAKPVLAMPVSLAALEDCRAMAAAAAGGEDALRARPLLVVYAEPVSPLAHPDESIGKLLYCADHGIPVAYVPYAAQGGTAPLSQAGIVAQLCAESLSALVIHQLQQPGAPFIFGGMASVMDMRTTVFSYGAPEFQLGNTLMAEMARHFELPNFGTAGTSDAQCFDGQAVLEATSSCLMAALSGAQFVHDVGLLGSATIVIPEMIVATDEIIGMIPHLLGDVRVDSETLSLDLFADAPNRGEFLMQPYTLEHMRDVWYPDLLYRGGARAWAPSQAETFERRINRRTREIMETHRPAVLPPDQAGEIDRILASAVAQAGAG